ncbi:hypothetical protein [Peribacillus frigoritolerans]|uniref:DUF4177 domain-containing protein n=1 Tax=Peribacillus castrilensis TaxID=2897690 RepID=A0AAW9NPR1_9BACI|nr:hypothetical protein [Peribacillus castrilensis]
MKPFTITMNDVNLESLIKRCEEKEAAGYVYVIPITPLNRTGITYSQGYGGQWKYNGVQSSTKYRVVMRKEQEVHHGTI